jgi:hypothetical protein
MDRGPLSSFVAWSRSHPSLKDDRPAITPIRLKVPLDDLTPGAIAETLTAISQVVDLAYRLYAAANPGAVLEPPVIYEIGIGSVSVSIGVAEGVARLVKSMLSTRDGIVQRGDRDRASSASADTAEATAQVAGVEAGAATQKADDDHELRLAQAEEIRANAHKTEAEAEAIRLANITRRLEVATAIASLGLDALQLAAIVCTQDEKALQYLIERGTTVEDE